MSLKAKFLKHWSALETSLPVTLLLSGGGDSVALFHLLGETGQEFQALHFVHDSGSDFPQKSSEFCHVLCAAHDVELTCVPISGRPLMKLGDLSWEAACRKLRYDHLAKEDACYLTAHTLDDQAETVLMRLLNGAGLSGLAGIREIREDGVVRPLLGVARSELREFLESAGHDWLEDPSNVDGNERALIRNEVLPSLMERKPNLQATLGRTAQRLAQDEEYLSRATWEWMLEHTLPGGDSWPLKKVQGLPAALRSRFVRNLWKVIGDPARRPRGSLFEECFRVIHGGRNEAEVLFPNGSALVILGAKIWARPSLPESDWSLDLEQLGEFENEFLRLSRQPFEGATTWPGGTELRSRRPGDSHGGKDLRKLLAVSGQPPWVRNRCPILLSGGQIVAVWQAHTRPAKSVEAQLWIKFSPSILRVNVLE